MSEPAPSKRTAEISQRLREIFGPGRAEIFVHSTDDGQGSVAILHANDRPRAGMTVYSTLNVNDIENLVDGQNMPVELLGRATDE